MRDIRLILTQRRTDQSKGENASHWHPQTVKMVMQRLAAWTSFISSDISHIRI